MALKKGLTITCGWVADDSWSLVTTPVASYFNANDCVGVEWRKVAAALGRRVDVLEARLLRHQAVRWLLNLRKRFGFVRAG